MHLSCEACGWKSIGLPLALLLAFAWAASGGNADEPAFRAYDGFDGKLALEWEPVRPDATHVSLEKNPGKLTITTQAGTIGFDETRVGRTPAKNLYLIPNPAAEGGDFAVTTCIESFNPTMNYQQAGLLVYDDDDNYIKCDMEWCNTAIRLKYMWETDQRRTLETDRATPSAERMWIRIIKRGMVYERAYSTDGKEFASAGQKSWGDGAPNWVGILAKNGPPTADEMDATFDFFEVRSLTDAEKNDPDYVERKKLRGTWEVVSCKFGGKALTSTPLSRFAFEGINVTIVEKTKSLETEFTLDVMKEPKGLVLSALSSNSRVPVGGVYSVEDDTLTICLGLDPEAAAPSKLETKEGDRRLLVTLRRLSDTKAAAIERND